MFEPKEPSNSGKWERGEKYLTRESIGIYGQKAIETFNPRLRIVNIYEAFTDGSYRLVTEPADVNVDDSPTFLIRKIETTKPVDVGYIDKKHKSTIHLKIPRREGDDIFVEGNVYVENIEKYENRPIIHLDYNPQGVLRSGAFREGIFIRSGEVNEEKPWQENIQTLVNVVRGSDQEGINAVSKLAKDEVDRLVDRFGQKSELVKFAREQANQVCDRAFNSLPQDNIDEYRKLLENVGFYDTLLYEILVTLKGNETPLDLLQVHDSDSLLGYTASRLITIMLDEEGAPSSLLKVYFGNEECSWVEVEEKDGLSIKEIMAETNDDELERRTSGYGEKITIQDHSYIITRKADIISVECLSNYGNKKKWISTFPLSINAEEVKRIASLKKKDFRKIKDISGVNLRVF